MNVYLIHDKILAESKKVPRPVRAQPREGRPQTRRARQRPERDGSERD